MGEPMIFSLAYETSIGPNEDFRDNLKALGEECLRSV